MIRALAKYTNLHSQTRIRLVSLNLGEPKKVVSPPVHVFLPPTVAFGKQAPLYEMLQRKAVNKYSDFREWRVTQSSAIEGPLITDIQRSDKSQARQARNVGKFIQKAPSLSINLLHRPPAAKVRSAESCRHEPVFSSSILKYVLDSSHLVFQNGA